MQYVSNTGICISSQSGYRLPMPIRMWHCEKKTWQELHFRRIIGMRVSNHIKLIPTILQNRYLDNTGKNNGRSTINYFLSHYLYSFFETKLSILDKNIIQTPMWSDLRHLNSDFEANWLNNVSINYLIHSKSIEEKTLKQVSIYDC